MIKISKVVKSDKKVDANRFFHSIVGPISKINFDQEASLNKLISFYVKESALLKLDGETDEIGNAYLSVAILLAFIERITSPFKKPSSIDEILDPENSTTEDMIAEFVGLLAKATFENNEELADKYLIYMAVLTKKLLEEEDSDISEVQTEAERADLAELMSNANEEPVFEDLATPV